MLRQLFEQVLNGGSFLIDRLFRHVTVGVENDLQADGRIANVGAEVVQRRKVGLCQSAKHGVARFVGLVNLAREITFTYLLQRLVFLAEKSGEGIERLGDLQRPLARFVYQGDKLGEELEMFVVSQVGKFQNVNFHIASILNDD
jgi:hypothetical protein